MYAFAAAKECASGTARGAVGHTGLGSGQGS